MVSRDANRSCDRTIARQASDDERQKARPSILCLILCAAVSLALCLSFLCLSREARDVTETSGASGAGRERGRRREPLLLLPPLFPRRVRSVPQRILSIILQH